LNSLRNDNFKSALVKFLSRFWASEVHSTILGNKTVTMNCGDHCYTFKVEDGVVVKREIHAMFSTHEEADSRMLFHISSVQPPANVVIRTIDTDVLVIALGCFSSLPQ
jgi:hypothetical protein